MQFAQVRLVKSILKEGQIINMGGGTMPRFMYTEDMMDLLNEPLLTHTSAISAEEASPVVDAWSW